MGSIAINDVTPMERADPGSEFFDLADCGITVCQWIAPVTGLDFRKQAGLGILGARPLGGQSSVDVHLSPGTDPRVPCAQADLSRADLRDLQLGYHGVARAGDLDCQVFFGTVIHFLFSYAGNKISRTIFLPGLCFTLP